jgi:hypothetical protein
MESMLIVSFGEAAQDVPVHYRFVPTGSRRGYGMTCSGSA